MEMQLSLPEVSAPPSSNRGDVWLTNSSITIDFLGDLPNSLAEATSPWKPYLLRAWESRSLLWEVIKLEGVVVLFLEYDPDIGGVRHRKVSDHPFVTSYMEYRRKHWGRLDHGN